VVAVAAFVVLADQLVQMRVTLGRFEGGSWVIVSPKSQAMRCGRLVWVAGVERCVQDRRPSLACPIGTVDFERRIYLQHSVVWVAAQGARLAFALGPSLDSLIFVVAQPGHRFLREKKRVSRANYPSYTSSGLPFSTSTLSKREFLYLSMRHSSAALR
jgi:hypothetical protein